MVSRGGAYPPRPGGEAGDGGFTGINGEIYGLTKEILYTVPAEDLKNVPCFFTLSEIFNVPSFPEGHTLYDFFYAEGLPEALPKIYALPGRTFLTYPDGIEGWYKIGYYVTWSKRGCEILDCELFTNSDPDRPDGPDWAYFGDVWADMFLVVSPCKPLRPFETKITFEKDIIIFRPSRAEAPNPFKAFQPK